MIKIIQPSYEIITPIYRQDILSLIEKIGRTCYKSEDKITKNSASKFVSSLVKNGHHAMIEFFDITVKFIHNRGFSHEMVRHRLCSFAQESTRYVGYDDNMIFIKPYWIDDNIESSKDWFDLMIRISTEYNCFRTADLPKQAVRGILPNDLKTEIVVKANLREWLNIFKLRCAKSAHPDMQRIMIPLREELAGILPEIFNHAETN